MNCPCCSKKLYQDCCQSLIENAQSAKTAEALMRSRYTAYTQANTDYIKKTMQGKAALGFNEQEAKTWAESIEWLGLRVIKHIKEKPDKAFVEFIARYRHNHEIHFTHELSEFHYIDEQWYYVNGKHKPLPSRNAPCPCGSGKKYKRCCLS